MLDRLGRPDRIAGAGALLALVGALLPWYHFTDGASLVTTNAFGSGFLGDVVFLAAASFLLVLLVRTELITLRRELDDRRLDRALGVTALVAALLQTLIGVNGSGAFHHATVGLGVTLLATLTMTVGAFMRVPGGIHAGAAWPASR